MMIIKPTGVVLKGKEFNHFRIYNMRMTGDL